MGSSRLGGSFRDRSGFVFQRDGVLFRQLNESCREDYDSLMGSGLYDHLVEKGLLIPHTEEPDAQASAPEIAYKVLRPERVPFVSYPYEWSFSQLKDAALLTLRIQSAARCHGMTLRDCSAYNVQFRNGRPVFIDTLSFAKYAEGEPWTPYGQFCRHFLAPLALMSLKDVRLQQLLRSNLDGIPLDLAAALLPRWSRLRLGLLIHLHAHAASQRRYLDRPIEQAKFRNKMSRTALTALIDSLKSTIRGLKWEPKGTEWADYYSDDSYTARGLEHKHELVRRYLETLRPSTVWDLGANNGFHSRAASEMGAQVIAFDADPACVEQNYLSLAKSGERNILPLLLDLTNPSPDIGWDNDERLSVGRRGRCDVAMALALVHHLAISNNVPLEMIAGYLGKLCTSLVIEFVPKSDAKVGRLLATREDVFPDYTRDGFEAAFGKLFTIAERDRIAESDRVLYLMHGRQQCAA